MRLRRGRGRGVRSWTRVAAHEVGAREIRAVEDVPAALDVRRLAEEEAVGDDLRRHLYAEQDSVRDIQPVKHCRQVRGRIEARRIKREAD